MNASPWFQRLSPQPEASQRLFCFHHAGGSAAAYRMWPRRLPELDVCAVQLPGRANRIMEPAISSMPALVDALERAIRPLLDRPCAFFGHSMGSALAWALASRLHETDGWLPSHLLVSGRQPPHKPYPEQSLRGLTDAQVVDRITSSYGGFPAEALASREFIDLFLPSLRADFSALDDAMPRPPKPLPMPITAFGGLGDPCSAPERLAAWQAYTCEPLHMHHFPGDHFYLDAQVDESLALVRSVLSPFGAPRIVRRAA